MASSAMVRKSVFSGVTIGGSGGGQPLPLVILTVVVVAMALVTVYQSVSGGSGRAGDPNRQLLFKCTDCGEVATKTIGELRKMRQGQGGPPMPMGMGMELPKYICPKCNKKTLVNAVRCAADDCDAVFIISAPGMAPPGSPGLSAACPKCGTDFYKAMRKKYAEKRKAKRKSKSKKK